MPENNHEVIIDGCVYPDTVTITLANDNSIDSRDYVSKDLYESVSSANDHWRAENAKLREQMERLVTLLRSDCNIDASWDGLRRFWSIGLTEDGCLMRDRACKAEAENSMLRELCKSMRCALADFDDKVYLTALDKTLIDAGFDLQKLGVEDKDE